MNTNQLSKILDWLRSVFEHASPSVFSLFATLLPYLSPLPVAVITAQSARTYLGFTPNIAGIFVFVLEGLGLWTTTVFVDTIVQYIRSRNNKTLIMVFVLLVVVIFYITILINLNVSLEMTTGDISPIYSRILTLICFLPLISGFMNGYWKLQLENKTEVELAKELEERRRQEDRQEREKADELARQERLSIEESRRNEVLELEEKRRQERLVKFRIKHGVSESNGTSESTSRSEMEFPKDFRNNNGTMGRPSVHQERVFGFMEQSYASTRKVPTFTEVMEKLKLPQSTASRLRNEWIKSKRTR